MLYAALIYSEEGTGPQHGTPEWDGFMQGYRDVTKLYEDTGTMVAGQPLQHSSTATSVRMRDGKMETIDGPFAETKERLGGFYILDCKDLDQAIELAAKIPTAQFGTVEVRPVMTF